jgi:hypothetical protein
MPVIGLCRHLFGWVAVAVTEARAVALASLASAAYGT